MRIALIGQAAFGESVLRALRDAGEQIVAVSSVRGSAERPDALWKAAAAEDIPLFPTAQLKKPDVLDAYAATQPDLAVMAFVTHILPERVLTSPPRGTIQYHPSLLPRHRGRSAMHWAIRMGDTRTGVTIFWVDEGIDTGPVLLREVAEIAPDDTVGSLYFDKLYPLGVRALVDAVRMVRECTAPRLQQDEGVATYEPPADDANSAIDWSRPAADVYNLVRGSNPQPGAHARFRGARLRVFDARLTPNDGPAPAPGTIVGVTDAGVDIALDGGVLHAQRVQPDGSAKQPAAAWAAEAAVQPGQRLDDGT